MVKYKLSKKYRNFISNVKKMSKKQIRNNLIRNRVIRNNTNAPSNLLENLLLFSHNMNIKRI